MIFAVIMAGGKGERFWPKSRMKLPKQLLKLAGDDTMIRATVKRLDGLVNNDDIYIVTGIDYASLISDQLPQVPVQNILIEPMGKNTAACIGLAALHIEKRNPEAVMLVLPSDHLIKNTDKFVKTLKCAIEVAQKGDNLVTLGIKPTRPETGYGYIQFNQIINKFEGRMVYEVKRFVEKPNLETAKKYIESGNFLWNSGMFIWKVSTILKNIEQNMPGLYQGLMKIKEAMGSDEEETVLYQEYSKFESISVDYGIMEKADSIYVVAADFDWDDVGSWTSLERIYEKDEDGNIIRGNIVSLDTRKCIIEGTDKLIATIGVEDLVIVDTKDAILICSKDKAQRIRDLLKKVKEQKSENYL